MRASADGTAIPDFAPSIDSEPCNDPKKIAYFSEIINIDCSCASTSSAEEQKKIQLREIYPNEGQRRPF